MIFGNLTYDFFVRVQEGLRSAAFALREINPAQSNKLYELADTLAEDLY
jgi:hypothetical protein